MKRLLIFYNFVICLAFFLTSLLGAESREEYVFACLFVPLVIYFGYSFYQTVLRRANVRIALTAAPAFTSTLPAPAPAVAISGRVLPELKSVGDLDKRLFLKLIAGSGLSVFLMALFTKDAKAAFFGSVPGPGTVAIKNKAGEAIDPAERQPTDGYEVSQIDDSSSPDFSYYGFVNKDGAWYIMREATTGADAGTYLYSAGGSGFTANWTGRSGLTYGTFDSTF